MFYGITFQLGGLLNVQRCQLWLLHPLRPLSFPSAGVTEYDPPLSGGSPGLMGFLRTLLSYYFTHCYPFLLLLQFKIKYRPTCSNLESTGKFKEPSLWFLEPFGELQPFGAVTLSQKPLWPSRPIMHLAPSRDIRRLGLSESSASLPVIFLLIYWLM